MATVACPHCKGNGILENGLSCPHCSGIGLIDNGDMDDILNSGIEMLEEDSRVYCAGLWDEEDEKARYILLRYDGDIITQDWIREYAKLLSTSNPVMASDLNELMAIAMATEKGS